MNDQPKPILVSGYVRNKREIETARRHTDKVDRADTIFAGLMVGSMLILLAVVFWKLTLILAVTTIAGILVKRWIAKKIADRRAELKLNINYYWRRHWLQVLIPR